MFQLESEVRRWCRRAIPAYWIRPAYLTEMEDHLLCVVEQLTRDGSTNEEAFRIATERLGEAKLLKDEFRKNARYSWNHSLRYVSRFAVIGCALAMVAALISRVDVTAWTHNLWVAIDAFPSSLLNYFL